MYPWILKPAEKLRRKIRNVSFGDDWWRDRITMLHWERQVGQSKMICMNRRIRQGRNESLVISFRKAFRSALSLYVYLFTIPRTIFLIFNLFLYPHFSPSLSFLSHTLQARMELLHGAEARKNRWEASRENRADVRKIRRRMGNPFFYLCPLFRPIFAHPCWDPKRKVSKLRNDAIKQRLETRYCIRETGIDKKRGKRRE